MAPYEPRESASGSCGTVANTSDRKTTGACRERAASLGLDLRCAPRRRLRRLAHRGGVREFSPESRRRHQDLARLFDNEEQLASDAYAFLSSRSWTLRQ